MKGFLILVFGLYFSAYAAANECGDEKSCALVADTPTAKASTSKRVNLLVDNNVLIGKYTVSAEVLNIRSAPNASASITGKLKQGEHVLVLSSKNNWRMIKNNNAFGWVSNRYISLSE